MLVRRRGPRPPHRALHTLSSIVDNLPPAVAKFHDVVAVKGEGVYVETACGRRLLDLTSGIGVTSTGHTHPLVVEAIKRQVCVDLDRRAVFELVELVEHSHARALPHTRSLALTRAVHFVRSQGRVADILAAELSACVAGEY